MPAPTRQPNRAAQREEPSGKSPAAPRRPGLTRRVQTRPQTSPSPPEKAPGPPQGAAGGAARAGPHLPPAPAHPEPRPPRGAGGLTFSSTQLTMMEGYLRLSQRKKAGTPMAAAGRPDRNSRWRRRRRALPGTKGSTGHYGRAPAAARRRQSHETHTARPPS